VELADDLHSPGANPVFSGTRFHSATATSRMNFFHPCPDMTHSKLPMAKADNGKPWFLVPEMRSAGVHNNHQCLTPLPLLT
jgi:hypothetical protein